MTPWSKEHTYGCRNDMQILNSLPIQSTVVHMVPLNQFLTEAVRGMVAVCIYYLLLFVVKNMFK